MKKNILFLLKFRNFIFNHYLQNKYYYFSSSNSLNILLNFNETFDNESILIIDYLYKKCETNKIYLIKSIEKYYLNILVSSYNNKDDVIKILKINNEKCNTYINKNIMSSILFVCKYKTKYIIFSSFIKNEAIKFDPNNDIQVELINYYFNDDKINNDKIWFSTNVVKYIKINDSFKVTKFYPFLINL